MGHQAFELTTAQREVWTALQVDPDDPAFNIGWQIDFHGMSGADVDRLESAVDSVVRAADALHVVFEYEDGGSVCQRPIDPPDDVVTRTACDEASADAIIADNLDHVRSLDGPLYTQRLFTMGDGRVRWFQGYHHIVVDAFAVRTLSRAVADVYNGGMVPTWSLRSLVDEEARYSGSASAGRDTEAVARLHSDIDEMSRLADDGAVGRDHGERATLVLGRAVDALADHPRTFAAALMMYVHRMTGRRDTALSMAVHTRNTDVRRREIGMLSRTHPVPGTVQATDCVRDVRERIDPWLDLLRDHGRAVRSHRPGVGANLMFWPTPLIFGDEQVRLRGVRLGPVHDVDFAVESEPGMGVIVDVRGPADTVEYHRDRLRHFLDQLSATTPAHAPSLLFPDESDRILHGFNDTRAERVPRTVPAMFEASVRNHAESTAVVDGDRTITYTDLDLRVSELAAALLERGLRPEQTVGIAISRSIETIVGALAVMNAGGAFVPLDPTWPETRRRDVATSARLGFQLVRSDDDSRALAIDGVPALVVDLDRWVHGDRPVESPTTADLHGASLAYVMFTSGSTGKPKGAMIRHEAICARMMWQIDEVLGFGSSDASLFKAPLSFDISVNEFLLPLLSGGRVVIAAPGDERDPHRLLQLIDSQRVTFVYLVSSMLDILLDIDAAHGRLNGLRHVWCGGEVLTPSLFSRFRSQLTTTLYHGYGPAEATIGVSHLIYRDTAERIATSIGRPNPNTELYVLDDNLAPLPVGVRGELYAAGELLGRGYVNAPTQTASRFVANPYGEPGARMYRTGDRASWNDDGTLEFAGRADNQVKIRGMRLELDEVEAVLSEHPGVRHCAVTVRRSSAGTDHLAAYVVAAGLDGIDPPALRVWAQERLPEYMVPTGISVLDTFPLTANGKLDRRALGEPEFLVTGEHREPSSVAEAAMCADFATILGRERVGADDDFFEAGGDSILGVRLAGSLSARTGLHIPVGVVFSHRSPAALSAWIDKNADALSPATDPDGRHDSVNTVPELSDAQRRMLLLHRLAPEAPTYTVPVVWEFDAADRPDPAVLEYAVRDVCERHAILRTIYPDLEHPRILNIEQSPALIVESPEPPAPESIVFDPAHELPIRVWWSDTRGVLTVAYSHIAVDDRSEKVFRHDLAEAYLARSAGQPPEWPPLATSYAEYAQRSHRGLGTVGDPGSAAARMAEHWRRVLTDPPEPSIADPMRVGSTGAVIDFELSAATVDDLRSAADRTSTSMFMLAHTATALAVSAMTGTADLLVAAPVSLRSTSDLDALIGCFLNTLILRTDLTGDPTVSELLARIRSADLDAYDNQELSYEDVVDVCGLASAQSPQVMAIYLPPDSGEGDLRLGTALGRRAHVTTGTAKFPLTFTLSDSGSAMRGTLEYAVDSVDDSMARRYVDCFVQALRTLSGDLDIRMSRRSLIGPEQTSQTSSWAHGPRRAVSDTTLADLVDSGLRLNPTATAVRVAGESIPFATLDADADRLADILTSHGVGPESVVGVSLPRSYELVLALVAIHRAGGAYLPLDATLPRQRLAYIVGDARPELVLTTDATTLPNVPVIDPSVSTIRSEEPLTATPRRAATADNLAYVIYTSGSTGRPKGTAVSHRAVVNRLMWMRDEFSVGRDDRILQKTPASFDVSVWEFFLPLMTGARLVVADPDAHTDPDRMRQTVDAESVTIAHFVPSMLDAYSSALPTDSLSANPSLRLVVSSGEALPAVVAGRILTALPNARLANLYGPTEAAIDVTSHIVSAESGSPVPIGTPVDNTTTHVLDHALRPVPPGAPGDLYLGGVQLARGYPCAPGLSATRFVADPHSDSGERLYRTGDRARWSESGELIYLGRDDDQVKINGMRIELGEIVEAIASLPDVETATVIVDDGVLVAYVVDAEASPPPQTLTRDRERSIRDRLATSLPRHMIPALFVGIEALPTTPNGKLDRAKLPALGRAGAVDAGERPRGETEEAVAHIFCDVLGADTIGRDRSILEWGANSLTAVRILARLRQELGIDIPLGRFVGDPTVAAASAGAATRRPQQTTPVRDLSAGQRRMWVDEKARGPNATYNIPFVWRHGLGTGRDRFTEIFDLALRDVAERHEILRTIYRAEDGTPRAEVLPTPARIAHTTQQTADELVRLPFAVDTDIPLRAFVSDVHIVIVVHHIAFDEWSRTVFFRDLSTAFSARDAGRAPTWDADAVQYRDVVAVDHVRPDDLDAVRQALSGLPESTDLPLDRPRATSMLGSRPGGIVRGDLDADVVAGLRTVATASSSTLAMVTSALTAAMIHAVGAADDLALGFPVTRRDTPGSESAIGYFLNTLVLRVDLGGHPSFRALVDRVRERTLSALDHAHVPFDRVAAVAGGDRIAGATGLFDIMVVHQSAEDAPAELRLGHTDIAGAPASTGTAKFDLTVEFSEEPSSGALSVSIEYGADIFDRSTADGMLARLQRIARQVANAPDRTLPDLNALSSGEVRRLREWAGHVEPTDDATLIDLLNDQVCRTPDACAVRFGGSELTFAELADRSRTLADRLRALGAGPNTVVGVHLARSTDLLVALMAVVRSGAAYLPLDPDYPAERLRYMVDDAEPTALVAHDGATTALGTDVPTVDPSEMLPAGIGDGSPGVSAVLAHPDDLVYVIYTSGSTGRPKGVGNTHRALVSHLRWMQREYALAHDDIVLQKTPAGFDVSVWEFFLAATTGACTVIAEPGGHRDPEYLQRTIRDNRVTTIHFVPPMLHAFLAAVDPSACSSLRRIVCSGEELPVEVAETTRRLLAHVRLDNLYGPTEAAIDVTRYTVDTESGGVPIGAPVDNTQIRILDRELRPVPPGVSGELYLAGMQMARGYHGRPGLTAQRFVADPFATAGRLYRTGDLARWRPDGLIDYLGRADDQVKIRGQRIELGEISTSIVEQCPSVSQAVVVVRDGRLIAYTVGTAGADEVIDAVGDRLPEHMVPANVVRMDALPLTPNGKVDRRALPAPAVSAPSRTRQATPDERALLEVLDRELGLTMDPSDDFFRNGGDSISAVLWAAKAASAGFSFGIRDVFEKRTPAALAEQFAPKSEPARRRSSPSDDGDVPVPLPTAVREARKSGAWDQVYRARTTLGSGLGSVDSSSIESALRERHDGLRLAVDTRRRTLWRARLVPTVVPEADPLDWSAGRGYAIDLSTVDGDLVVDVAVHGLIGGQRAADGLADAVRAHIEGDDDTHVSLHHISEGAEQHA